MVAAILVVNTVYPAVVRSSNSITMISDRLEDRISSQVDIVYALGELDKNGSWQDTDSDGYFDVVLWVKNVGSSRIIGIDQMDVFFGKAGTFRRIPYVDDAGGGYPRWIYTLENGTEWGSTVTVKVQVHYTSALTSDTYVAKVIVPSGAYDELTFSF